MANDLVLDAVGGAADWWNYMGTLNPLFDAINVAGSVIVAAPSPSDPSVINAGQNLYKTMNDLLNCGISLSGVYDLSGYAVFK
jgi:hypothetical protein